MLLIMMMHAENQLGQLSFVDIDVIQSVDIEALSPPTQGLSYLKSSLLRTEASGISSGESIKWRVLADYKTNWKVQLSVGGVACK